MKYYVTLTICLLISLYACRTRKVQVKSSIYNTKMEIQTKRYPITVFEGSIKDINTNEVIPFAEVKLRDKDGINRGTATDTAGYFIIKNLPLGNCKLYINVDGYQESAYEFNISEHKYYKCEIKLKKIRPEKPNQNN
jgi:CarboxypepD_reg-like domain